MRRGLHENSTEELHVFVALCAEAKQPGGQLCRARSYFVQESPFATQDIIPAPPPIHGRFAFAPSRAWNVYKRQHEQHLIPATNFRVTGINHELSRHLLGKGRGGRRREGRRGGASVRSAEVDFHLNTTSNARNNQCIAVTEPSCLVLRCSRLVCSEEAQLDTIPIQ